MTEQSPPYAARSPRLAIVGAGQLGSRHLQSLARLAVPAMVDVVDPDPRSLEEAKRRLAEAGGPGALKEVRFLPGLSGLSGARDVVIVATTASVRQKVVEELLSRGLTRHLILEKVLFQRLESYELVSRLLKEGGARAWVNCPRRLWPFYQELRPSFAGGGPIAYSVTGSDLNIGSNAIHPMDHLAFFAGESDYRVRAEGLDPIVGDSKRPGFVEFMGTLEAALPGGSRLLMTSYAQGGIPPLIQMTSAKARCIVREAEGRAWLADAATGWSWREASFETPKQSELTHGAVEEILRTGECGLTPYAESMRMHLPLLAALMGHLSASQNRTVDLCPIT